jgi:hypothetical protein
MVWYIVHPDEEFQPGYNPATARVSYGSFDNRAEAQEFQDEPANRNFDEAHGPIVQIWPVTR